MGKAILAAIFTLIAGYLGTVIGLEVLGGWTEFGVLVAVALMVALVTRYNMTEMFSQEDFTMVKNPGRKNTETFTEDYRD